MNTDIVGNRASRASALKQQILNAELATVPFTLVNTGGVVVEVQRPSLAYLMSTGAIPSTFRKIVDSHVRKFGKETVSTGRLNMSDDEVNGIFAEHGIDLVTFMEDVYESTVIAGFIVPPVTKDREYAATHDEYVWIGDIHPLDREAFYLWCNATSEAEADAVKSDSGRESDHVSLGLVPDGEVVREDAVNDESGVVLGSRSDQI